MEKKVIELHNIKRNFQVGEETVHALRGISFTINEGEFVTIMGTSGSGNRPCSIHWVVSTLRVAVNTCSMAFPYAR